MVATAFQATTAQGLPAPHNATVDCQVLHGPSFPPALPLERCHLPCTEPRGRGESPASPGPRCQHNARGLSEGSEGGPWGLEVAGFLSTPRSTFAPISSFKDKLSHCFFFFFPNKIGLTYDLGKTLIMCSFLTPWLGCYFEFLSRYSYSLLPLRVQTMGHNGFSQNLHAGDCLK